MKIEIMDSSFSQEKYNKAAKHPLQSWQWGEARKKLGTEVIRVGEFGDELVNVYQITIHPLPHTPFKIGYLPRSVMPSKEVLEFLSDFGKKHGLIFIKIEPDVAVKEESEGYRLQEFQHDTINIKESSHPLFPKWTQVLDLNKSEEELLEQMKPKTRYNIRLAQKKGVIVKEESNEKGFEIFRKLYFETTKRQHYFGHTPRYHEIIWNTLKNEIAHILVAYYQDKPLVCYELFYFQNKLYYPYGGSSDEHRNVMAANLIMWESILFGKKLGATAFDMWGSLPPNYEQNNPWAGFTRFKEGYGAEFTEMIGSFDLIINPNLYKTYSALYKLRQFLLKFKR